MSTMWIYYVIDIDLYTDPFDGEKFMSVTMGTGYKEGRDGPTHTTMSLIPYKDLYRFKDIHDIEKELDNQMRRFDTVGVRIIWSDESTRKAAKILSKLKKGR